MLSRRDHSEYRTLNSSAQALATRATRFRLKSRLASLAMLGLFSGCNSGQVAHEADGTDSGSQAVQFDANSTMTISQTFQTPTANGVPLEEVASGTLTGPSGTSGASSTEGQINATPVSLQTSATARQWLDAVIDRYQKAKQYSDQAYVRLTYRRLGEKHEDKAPLAVSFYRDRGLHVKAYAAEIAVRQGRFQAAITDPLTNNFDGQIVDRTLSTASISLAEIYSDPELTHFASAGLGGPSPQLELLLSSKPLAGLFEGSANLILGNVESLTQSNQLTGSRQSYACQKLTINSDSLQYHLWIDKDSGIVKRIELPAAAAGLDADPSVTDVKLSIELEDAKFAIPSTETFQLPNEKFKDPNLKRVRTFVPLPPPIISELLGRKVPEFSLSGPDGNLLASERGSDRARTVLLWIADHPASRLAASELQVVADSREKAGKKDSRCVIVMAEPRILRDTLVSPQASTNSASLTGSLLRSWKVGLPFADDSKAIGRDIFEIAEAPTLVVLGENGVVEWYQPRVGPELSMQLPMLLDDLAKGKEVGKEIRGRYEADQQTYKKLLDEAAAK